MSRALEQIRALAERVAHGSGLELVDLEFEGGGGKHRTLRVFLERDAAGRAELAQRLSELRAQTPEDTGGDGVAASKASAGEEAIAPEIEIDLVAAGEAAGMSPEEDELAYLREVPEGVPVAQLSGITHGDCERFARDFGTALDVEDLVPGTEYTLEVSSPGLDRKLKQPSDFERFGGQLCKVQTFTPVRGNRHWLGRLGAGPAGSVVLTHEGGKPSKKKGAKTTAAEPVEIALNNIEKAQLVPEI